MSGPSFFGAVRGEAIKVSHQLSFWLMLVAGFVVLSIVVVASNTVQNLPELATRGLLSQPPANAGGYPLPGDAVTATALGYLHANCGHCHNKNGTAWPDTQMVLRMKVTDTDVATSGVYASIVGQPLEYWRGGPITLRVAPGAPDMSGLIARMMSRTPKTQMPPLATELVDPSGIAAVSAWISALPP